MGVCSGVSGVWSVMVSAEVAVEAANMNPRTPEINLSGGHLLRRFMLGKEQIIYHASVLSRIVTLSFRQSSGISRLAWGPSTYDVHIEFGMYIESTLS